MNSLRDLPVGLSPTNGNGKRNDVMWETLKVLLAGAIAVAGAYTAVQTKIAVLEERIFAMQRSLDRIERIVER